MGKSTPLMPLLATTALLLTTASASLDPIVIKTEYTDPLADSASCTRDIPYLRGLGVNTIRTYAIDPTQDHSACMKELDAAGIYVISDLSEPNQSIDQNNPEWTTTLFNRYTSVVDAFSTYTNVIGFFAGNEVINNLQNTASAAMVKAAVRDTKAYIKSKNYQAYGVGYAADDDPTVRAQVAAYFNCGDVASQIDFWGYNIYEWCGQSDYQTSGYAARVAEFSNYSAPSFFAEYGCNTPKGGAAARPFTEVAALYGSEMTPVFSGGIVFEYFEETNDYGLVSVSGSSVSTLADYNALSTQLASVSPSATQMASYTPTNTVGQACPPVASNWNASSVLPPTPDKNVCSCMMSTLSCQAKASIDVNAFAPLFAQVCSYPGACAQIDRNFTVGSYGIYSMCNATEQLSWAFNTYYQSLSSQNKATGCDFGSNATLVASSPASGTCSSVLSSASVNAVTSSGSGSGSGSGQATGAAGSSATKKSDGAVFVGATLGMGPFIAVGFTLIAAFSGAGMILL
ncbi:hypothetical protein G7Y89_g15123 [Cudoniella acicularis]|uniref:1,3-beta-glucanosyltransferase n=1 Tax=Cudoniella acicularis TaxID=354080 RepID=A0A8H4VR50_9HELO|nr:hypothetical protein G7Y89_g15123 [Cudoniella acicularis]